MIHNIFPTKVLIKELDFSDEFTTDLTATIEAIYKHCVDRDWIVTEEVEVEDEPEDIVKDVLNSIKDIEKK